MGEDRRNLQRPKEALCACHLASFSRLILWMGMFPARRRLSYDKAVLKANPVIASGLLDARQTAHRL